VRADTLKAMLSTEREIGTKMAVRANEPTENSIRVWGTCSGGGNAKRRRRVKRGTWITRLWTWVVGGSVVADSASPFVVAGWWLTGC